MFKVFRAQKEKGVIRFEVYEEDEAGNTVQTLPHDYGTPEEAKAKADELNGPKGEAENKPVDSVQPPAPADEGADDGSKSGDEGSEKGEEEKQPGSEETGAPKNDGEENSDDQSGREEKA